MATRYPADRSTDESQVTDAGITTSVNAIELLEQDHRQVEEWFEQFGRTDDAGRKESLARDICKALDVHAQIEEEIFYPAFIDAGGDAGLHHESIIEHESARDLIAKIRHSGGAAADDFFDARVKVLEEMVRHHVEEEEKPGGMFEQAQAIGMDLDLLGPRLERRKVQLMDDAETDAGYDAAVGVPDAVQSISPGLANPDLRRGAGRR
jgi:hemerythrin superfamily protein